MVQTKTASQCYFVHFNFSFYLFQVNSLKYGNLIANLLHFGSSSLGINICRANSVKKKKYSKK